LNLNEDFNSFINEIRPDRYKILQMSCDDHDKKNKNNMVSIEGSKRFLARIKYSYIYESADEMKEDLNILSTMAENLAMVN
jgi:hypothetical protein